MEAVAVEVVVDAAADHDRMRSWAWRRFRPHSRHSICLPDFRCREIQSPFSFVSSTLTFGRSHIEEEEEEALYSYVKESPSLAFFFVGSKREEQRHHQNPVSSANGLSASRGY